MPVELADRTTTAQHFTHPAGEIPLSEPKSTLPANRSELFRKLALMSLFERCNDFALFLTDTAQTDVARTRLEKELSLKDEVQPPAGNSSALIIMAGLGGNAAHYEHTQRYFKKDGFDSRLMPLEGGMNLNSLTPKMAAAYMDFISRAADETSSPVCLVTHSKGFKDAASVAASHPEKFRENVRIVFQVAAPSQAHWVNSMALAAILIMPGFSDEDIRSAREPVTIFRHLNVPTVSILTRYDAVTRGTSDADIQLAYEGPHNGALYIPENLRRISSLSRTPLSQQVAA